MAELDQVAQELLDALDRQALLRDPPCVARGPAVATVDGRELLEMSSNDYLGLTTDPRLQEAWRRAADEAVGAGASRLITGSAPIHLAVEAALAAFVGRPSALLFSTGYAANVGTLSAVVGPGDIVFSDALDHASLIDGCRLSRARIVVYPHGDMRALDALLAKHRCEGERALVITDSVFSMDGERADVVAIDRLVRTHDAWWLVDEAHALGVVGPGGRGVCAEAGVVPDLLVGTLGKAFGVFGAFVGCTEPVRQLLVQRARSYVFSTAPPPALAAVLREAIALVAEGEALRKKVRVHARRLREGLTALGYRVGGEPDIPILPVHFGDPETTLRAASMLRELGILAHPIRPPTVPAGTSRIRLVPTAAHDDEHVSAVIRAFETIAPHVRDAARTGARSTPCGTSGPRLFVSGTGTGVGKTFVTRGLARALRRRGIEVVAIKPIETGCAPEPHDARALERACGRADLADAPGLYRTEPALGPAAVRLEGGSAPDFEALVDATRELSGDNEAALIEGAGGLLVPLDDRRTIADLASALGHRVLLVARDALGVQSSVLTCFESASRRGLDVAAVVLCAHGDDDPSQTSNRAILERHLPCPIVVFPATNDDDDALADAADASGLTALVRSPSRRAR